MSLRFQKADEIDEERKDNRASHTSLMALLFVIMAGISALGAWLSGDSLHSYGRDMVELLAFFAVAWFVWPIYDEHRNRSKET